MLPCVQPYFTSKAKTKRVTKGVTFSTYYSTQKKHMSKKIISPTPHSDAAPAIPPR